MKSQKMLRWSAPEVLDWIGKPIGIVERVGRFANVRESFEGLTDGILMSYIPKPEVVELMERAGELPPHNPTTKVWPPVVLTTDFFKQSIPRILKRHPDRQRVALIQELDYIDHRDYAFVISCLRGVPVQTKGFNKAVVEHITGGALPKQ